MGKPNFGSHFRVFVEDDGSKRLVGTSFDDDLRQGNLTFFEYSEQMELLYRTTAELPVSLCQAALLPNFKWGRKQMRQELRSENCHRMSFDVHLNIDLQRSSDPVWHCSGLTINAVTRARALGSSTILQ